MGRGSWAPWLCGLAAVATITASYSMCYSRFYEPQCASAGNCYSQCTPQGCSQSTCLIATQAGYEYGQFNVYPSGALGGWRLRADTGQKNICHVNGCRVWNNCTQAYEYAPINGCSCDGPVTQWMTQPPEGCP
jgi:hypothetical protein